MEETHQKVIEDIQRQHQREIRKLLEEKERLLEEETNATIAGNECITVYTKFPNLKVNYLFVSANCCQCKCQLKCEMFNAIIYLAL